MMHQPFQPARAHGSHLFASNDARPGLLNQREGGRRVDAARDEVPSAPQRTPPFDVGRPPARSDFSRWLPWVLLAVSLSVNAGLIARLAWVGGHF